MFYAFLIIFLIIIRNPSIFLKAQLIVFVFFINDIFFRIEEIKKDHEHTLELLQQRSHNTKSESCTLEEQIAILQ